jgi:hypothetical protein
MEDDIWERMYFKEPYKSPFLFYVLFGTDNISKLAVSKSKHNIDEKPNELEIINYCKSENNEHKNYIEGFCNQHIGIFLKEKNKSLYEKVNFCNNVTVIKGEFKDNHSLNYLKNTIGIIQSIIETDITAVLDLQIFEWFEPEEWSKKYFEQKSPVVHNHRKILLSDDSDTIWLHTRGMRKFGRPDISIKKVSPGKKELGVEVINRFIEAFAYGLVPDETRKIWIKGMKKGVYGKVSGDYENLDFNNFYFEIDEI